MKIIALLSSVPFESDMILASLKNVRTGAFAGKKIYRGKLSGRDTLLMNTGIGKVNAAHSVTCIIENFDVKNVINFGAGGAYPGSGLAVGDIAVATREIYGDDGVAGLRDWKGMEEVGIPLVLQGKKKYFNEFPVPLHTAVYRSRFMANPPFSKIKTGPFVTVSAVSGVRKRAVELEERFNAICENMEGAAIAHVCMMHKIPFSEIRGISNIAGERNKGRWNLTLASTHCQTALMEALKRS
jgi:futalosine hydrolase